LTLPLYGPRTYRADDYNDPIHLERISTLNMFITKVKIEFKNPTPAILVTFN
jgi:hypothetical protein